MLDRDAIQELVETIESAEEIVLGLEESFDQANLFDLKRYLHTLKGTLGMVEERELEKIYHELESHLDEQIKNIQTGVVNTIPEESTTCMLTVLDLSREYLTSPDKQLIERGQNSLKSLESDSHKRSTITQHSSTEATNQKNMEEFDKKTRKIHEDGLNVFIIDDDAQFLDMVEDLFHELGHNPFSFLEGNDFHQNTLGRAPDLVLVDFWLGEESGLQLIEAISSKNPLIPVVLMSGINDDLGLIRKASQAGACYFLGKPLRTLDFENLLALTIKFKKLRTEESNSLQTESSNKEKQSQFEVASKTETEKSISESTDGSMNFSEWLRATLKDLQD